MTSLPFGTAGTAEAVWETWTVPRRWPLLDLGPPGRAVIASPHPDDETLGVGGTVWMLARHGWTVEVVAVTDGEGSHRPTPRRSAPALAAIRRAEHVAALECLGVGAQRVHRLGLADGGVADDEGAVVDGLLALLTTGDWLIAPWDHDGHRDHDAVGRAAAQAAAYNGARLLSYPVWAWHWASPHDPALAAWRGVRVDLVPGARRAKATALAQYRSQTRAMDDPSGGDVVLPPRVLAHHRRPWEILLT